MQTAAVDRLTPENAVVLFVDQQAGLFTGVRDMSPLIMQHNVISLARSAKFLNVLAVLTANGPGGMFGPVIHELTDLFPDQEVIDRSVVNAWEDARVREAIIRTGRQKIVIAGLALGVCATLPALSAVADGYVAYVAVNASGSFDALPLTELLRLTQAGVIVADAAALVVEMMGDNAHPKARDIYGALGLSPASFLAQVYAAHMSNQPTPVVGSSR
jgi:nicotinamidase-related amidase